MNRRSFLQLGALGSLAPSLLHAIDKKAEEKACVFIFLGGGITHIEWLNPIPEAPVEYRSMTGAIKTKSGWDIGGSFPELAKISDKFTAVRSYHHKDANHHTATHAVMTGHINFAIPEGGEQKEPAYGAYIAQKFGESRENGVPTYIKTNDIAHDKSAWLGVKFAGFDYNDSAIKNLSLTIPKDRFKSRLEIMSIIDGDVRNQIGLDKQWGELKQTATKVITGVAGESLDVNKATAADKEYYGIDKYIFGRNLLIARRSLEAGAKFITVNLPGWDMHGDLNVQFPQRAVELDKVLSAFILDLEQRGMLKNTLVVVASEFGRTPKINATQGRDHHPSANSLLLAGGKYGGGLIGKTDSKAVQVEDNPFGPEDLTYTVLNHFGIEKGDALIDNMRRPRYLIEDKAKLI